MKSRVSMEVLQDLGLSSSKKILVNSHDFDVPDSQVDSLQDGKQ